jgi:site-specific DNA-cytosine methylase
MMSFLAIFIITMNALELFAGTHSVGKCCEELGWNVVSLDIDGRASINEDILTWDYKVYPKDYFSLIWASPPCDRYSILNYSNIGKKLKRLNWNPLTMNLIKEGWVEADKLVIKTLEIIKYFNPEVWFIENPQTSQLKKRDIMKDVPYYDVDYCKYSSWGYRKRTRIWTNKKDWSPLICKNDCPHMMQGKRGLKHINSLSSINMSGTDRLDLRHRIPPNLIMSLFLD